MLYGLYLLIGAVFSGGIVWFIYSAKANKIIDDLRRRLAVSEERNFQIPKLELVVAEKKREIDVLKEEVASLGGEIVSLKDDVAGKIDEINGLKQDVIDQKEAANDKLAMVNDAQGRLSNAMTELSQTAMHCDNEEFAEAMKSNLDKFQQDVLKDIAKWQGLEEVAAEMPTEVSLEAEITEEQDNTLEELVVAVEEVQEETPEESDAEDVSIDVQLAATEEEIDFLQQELDEEIAVEIEEPLMEEEKLEEAEAVIEGDSAPVLKFEASEVDSESPVSLMADDSDEVKKKMNGESDEMQIRKEAG
jgi:hypothetical protein